MGGYHGVKKWGRVGKKIEWMKERTREELEKNWRRTGEELEKNWRRTGEELEKERSEMYL